MSAPARVLERVSKLIALTASPNANEASNAAVAACRLIREHGLSVVHMSKVRVEDIRVTVNVDTSPPRDPWAEGSSWLDDLMKKQAEKAVKEAADRAKRERLGVSAKFRAKYATPCTICGKTIPAKHAAAHTKKGVAHNRCALRGSR